MTSSPIIVVDNGSTDGTATAARALGATVLERPGLKVGELRNQGAAAARTPLLAFVDADHEIAPGWMAAALAALDDGRVAGTGAPYTSPPRPTWVQRLYDAFRAHRPAPHDVAWLGAGNLVVRADVFRAVGGFDTTLEACEDVDFCQKLTGAGHVLRCEPAMRSVHYGDPRTLRALFKSELWRGRGNLRVSLRGSLTPSSLPSIVIPIVDLAALAAAALGLVVWSPLLIVAAAGAFLGLAGLRAFMLWKRLDRSSLADLGRAFAVASTYDLARALALVSRTPHRRAHGGETAAVTR